MLTTKLKLTRPLAFIDAETTGVDPVNDRIISFAVRIVYPEAMVLGKIAKGIKSSDGLDDEFFWEMNPGIPIPAQSTAIHGYDNAMVENLPPFEEFATEIFQALHGCDIAGFNVSNFDVTILWEHFYRCEPKIVWNLSEAHVVDVGTMFKLLEPRDLSSAVAHYCNRIHEGAHGAMPDVNETINVLFEMLLGSPTFFAGAYSAQVMDLTFQRYQKVMSMDVPALARFSTCDRDGNQRADLAGIIVKDNEGVYRYTHKKVRGVAVRDDIGYAEWMLSKDFPAQTKLVLRDILEEIWKSPVAAEADSLF